LHVRDWGSAFGAAIVIAAIGWILAGPLQTTEAAMLGLDARSASTPAALKAGLAYATYLHIAFLFLRNSVLLFVVALFVPAIIIRGMRGLLLAGALLTVIDLLVTR
jgi:hypothetical protein